MRWYRMVWDGLLVCLCPVPLGCINKQTKLHKILYKKFKQHLQLQATHNVLLWFLL